MVILWLIQLTAGISGRLIDLLSLGLLWHESYYDDHDIEGPRINDILVTHWRWIWMPTSSIHVRDAYTAYEKLHSTWCSPGFYIVFHIRRCKQLPGGPSLSFPLPPLPSLPHLLSSTPISIPSFRSRPIKSSYGGLGERCKLPSWVWGGAPAEIEFGAF